MLPCHENVSKDQDRKHDSVTDSLWAVGIESAAHSHTLKKRFWRFLSSSVCTLQLEKVPEGEMFKLDSYPNVQTWIIFLSELRILCRANKERNSHQEKNVCFIL